jgi:hypothetical protein
MLLNIVALWKQEARNPALTSAKRARPEFNQSWAKFRAAGGTSRVLIAVALGTAGFSMQDILLEPYGAEILKLTVGQTTALTAFFALGTLAGFGLAARSLGRNADPYRIAGLGAVAGIFAFAAVIIAAPAQSVLLFRIGTALIGFGGGLFAAGTLTAAMAIASKAESGIVLGTWGRAGDRGGRWNLAWWRHSRRGVVIGFQWNARSGSRGSGDWIQRRLQYRNRVAVRNAGCDRPARAHSTDELLAIFIQIRPSRISRLTTRKGSVPCKPEPIWTSHRSHCTYFGFSLRP